MKLLAEKLLWHFSGCMRELPNLIPPIFYCSIAYARAKCPLVHQITIFQKNLNSESAK